MEVGYEVHIITGTLAIDDLIEDLRSKGIAWTHWFSIVQYHLDKGDVVVKFVDDQPWMNKEVWNRTKTLYCVEEEIDMVFDDSPVYGSYFNDRCLYLLQKDQSAQEIRITFVGRI